MAPIFSRSAFQSSRPLAWWLLGSFAVCTLLIALTKSPYGDFLGHFTDHLHHPLATWTFLVRGLEAYREPLEITSQGTGYLQQRVPWEHYPVAYPPGMFVTFFLPALGGRFVPLSEVAFAKAVILYLTAIVHVALWAMAHVFRRVGSRLWIGVLVFVWIFMCRLTMLGFYDGAWLLAGTLGIDQMLRKKHGPAVACFLLSALISYRAVGFAVIGLWAFIELMKSDAKPAHKTAYAVAALVATSVVGWTFMMLVRHSPADQHGVSSALMPMSFIPYVILFFGLGVGAVIARSVSLPIGATVALTSGLSILHAGHQWHACLCIPPLLALPLAKERPLWAQVLLTFWFVFYLRYAFWFEPLEFVDELLRFTERSGLYVEGGLRPCR